MEDLTSSSLAGHLGKDRDRRNSRREEDPGLVEDRASTSIFFFSFFPFSFFFFKKILMVK